MRKIGVQRRLGDIRFECGVYYLFDSRHGHKFKLLANVLRNFLGISLVLVRQDDAANARTMRGEDLFL